MDEALLALDALLRRPFIDVPLSRPGAGTLSSQLRQSLSFLLLSFQLHFPLGQFHGRLASFSSQPPPPSPGDDGERGANDAYPTPPSPPPPMGPNFIGGNLPEIPSPSLSSTDKNLLKLHAPIDRASERHRDRGLEHWRTRSAGRRSGLGVSLKAC